MARRNSVELARSEAGGEETALAIAQGASSLTSSKQLGARRGFAVGDDGTPLYYELSGAAGATAVCLSDGIGCDGFVWKYLGPALGEERPVVHWHYRGHGKTPLPRDPERVGIADCADDLVAVLDAATLQFPPEPPAPLGKVFLVGHSMGVQVCLETYRRHRERVAGLVLVCGSYGTPLRTFKNSRVLEDVLPAVRLAVRAMPRLAEAFFRAALPTRLAYEIATLTELNGALLRPEDFFPYLEHMAQVSPRLFVDMLAAAGRHTALELLPEVDVPTLIVAGDADGFTPLALSEQMHRLVPGSELHVVHGGSHAAPIEKPDEVTARVAEFLRRHR